MGFAMVAGGKPDMAAPGADSAGMLAVGTSVFLCEVKSNQTYAEYIVVNQGIPSNSSLYDASCDGTWLLRKDCYERNLVWNASNVNDYGGSYIHTLLSDLVRHYGDAELAAIKTVKIPYRPGGGTSLTVNSGANGLTATLFLPSAIELGSVYHEGASANYYPVDGAKLEYFESGETGSANSKRIAKMNGSAVWWRTRSPRCDASDRIQAVASTGQLSGVTDPSDEGPVRFALVISKNAKFDLETMRLVEVS